MRGILSFGRSIIAQVQDTGLSQAIYNAAMDVRDGFKRRFGFSTKGIFIWLPFTTTSLWVEWRELWVGFGMERSSPADVEFFFGRIQGVLSVEGER